VLVKESFWQRLYMQTYTSSSFQIKYLGTNLMGKFTQSVKRIVQEVKEDGTQGK